VRGKPDTSSSVSRFPCASGAPAGIATLNTMITQLEQQAADLRIQLSERDDELAAARAANPS
jgi:hypothetical protein